MNEDSKQRSGTFTPSLQGKDFKSSTSAVNIDDSLPGQSDVFAEARRSHK